MGRYDDIDSLVKRYWKIIKVPHDPATKEFIGECQSHTIKVNGTPYKYFRRGNGPVVLLVHGLHSNLGSMVPIARSLADDYQVVLFDAPAHGEALGTSTNPLEIRQLMRAMGERLGALHAVVGHSLGALWAFSAWHEDFDAKAFVSISSPANHRFLVEKFIEMHDVGPDLAQGLFKEVEGCLGGDVWTEYSPADIVKEIGIPGLVVHGTGDDFVPPRHAAELHANWPGSRLEMIEESGHFDITGSRHVRTLVTTYLREVG